MFRGGYSHSLNPFPGWEGTRFSTPLPQVSPYMQILATPPSESESRGFVSEFRKIWTQVQCESTAGLHWALLRHWHFHDSLFALLWLYIPCRVEDGCEKVRRGIFPPLSQMNAKDRVSGGIFPTSLKSHHRHYQLVSLTSSTLPQLCSAEGKAWKSQLETTLLLQRKASSPAGLRAVRRFEPRRNRKFSVPENFPSMWSNDVRTAKPAESRPLINKEEDKNCQGDDDDDVYEEYPYEYVTSCHADCQSGHIDVG